MNKRQENNTQQLFDLIRTSESERDSVLRGLYKDETLRSMIYKFVLSNGGTENDARSVFNYALAKFVKSVIKNHNLEIKDTISKYIYGIARFTWYDELGKKVNYTEFDESFMTQIVEPPKRLELQERNEMLKNLLDKMMRNCKEVLMFWASGFSMNEIADKMGYKSFKMAKKKKYECMKQLSAYLNDNPEIKARLK